MMEATTLSPVSTKKHFLFQSLKGKLDFPKTVIYSVIVTNFSVPSNLVRLSPSSVLVNDPLSNQKRTNFAIDERRSHNILNRTPRPTSTRYLSSATQELSLSEQKKFRDVGNNALVSQVKRHQQNFLTTLLLF